MKRELASLSLAAALSACGPQAPQRPPSPGASDPADVCEAHTRDIRAGETARVCVVIGRASVVRLAPLGAEPARVVICNTSTQARVSAAWTNQAPATAGPGDIWRLTPKGQRLAIAAGACIRPSGPARAVVLRGWSDTGQGYEFAASWTGTVTFQPGT